MPAWINRSVQNCTTPRLTQAKRKAKGKPNGQLAKTKRTGVKIERSGGILKGNLKGKPSQKNWIDYTCL